MAQAGGVSPFPVIAAVGAALLVLAAAWRPAFADFAPAGLAILVAVAGVALVTALGRRSPEAGPLTAIAVSLFGALYVGLPMAFVPLLHGLPEVYGWSSGSAWAGGLVVALPLAATWFGDAVAFFAGTAWGQGGLAPSISPNKSWVGVWGGLLGAGVAGAAWFAVSARHLPDLPIPGYLVAAILGMLLAWRRSWVTWWSHSSSETRV